MHESSDANGSLSEIFDSAKSPEERTGHAVIDLDAFEGVGTRGDQSYYPLKVLLETPRIVEFPKTETIRHC